MTPSTDAANRLPSRRTVLGGFIALSLAGCIGGRAVDEAIEEGVDAVEYGFRVLDPDGVTSMPLDHQLEELESSLPPAMDLLDDTKADADGDDRSDLETLHATASTQLSLGEAYRGFRNHAEAYSGGLDAILDEPTDPAPATNSFEEARSIVTDAATSVDEAADAWEDVDQDRLRALEVEPTFDRADIDELGEEASDINRLTELVEPLPIGVAAMEFATDAYEGGSYDEAVDYYTEARTAFEPVAEELPAVSERIEHHPDRSATEGFGAAAAQAAVASGHLAEAARARADGDVATAEDHEADSGIEELPPSWQPEK